MTVTVDPTGGLGQTEMLRRVATLAEQAVRRSIGDENSTLRLINQSENTTYLVESDHRDPFILRVHRTGYHSLGAIESELTWLDALRNDAGVPTPRVIPGPDGTRVQHITTAALPEGRHCVFFEFLEGEEPAEDNLVKAFPNLGEITARMHQHVKHWTLPPHFERFTWNLETAFGAKPHWGHWYDAPAMTLERRRILERLLETLTRRLNAFGYEPDRFGLAHCDMRLANLLIHRGDTRVIDFDDCGFSWYLYDMATALTFSEDRADVPELIDAWLTGYSRVARLEPAEINEIPTLIMFRRMLALAWTGSHSETELARSLASTFAPVTCELAERYLTTHG